MREQLVSTGRERCGQDTTTTRKVMVRVVFLFHQVVSGFREKQNLMSKSAVFLWIVMVWLPLRMVVFMASRPDEYNWVQVMYLTPVILQFAAFSLWVLFFWEVAERVTPDVLPATYCRCCRLTVTGPEVIYLVAMIIVGSLTAVEIGITLSTSPGTQMAPLVVVIQRIFAGIVYILLAGILSYSLHRVTSRELTAIQRSMLPRSSAVLSAITVLLSSLFAGRAMLDFAFVGHVLHVPPFPPLHFTHACYFLALELLPISLAMALTLRARHFCCCCIPSRSSRPSLSPLQEPLRSAKEEDRASDNSGMGASDNDGNDGDEDTSQRSVLSMFQQSLSADEGLDAVGDDWRDSAPLGYFPEPSPPAFSALSASAPSSDDEAEEGDSPGFPRRSHATPPRPVPPPRRYAGYPGRQDHQDRRGGRTDHSVQPGSGRQTVDASRQRARLPSGVSLERLGPTGVSTAASLSSSPQRRLIGGVPAMDWDGALDPQTGDGRRPLHSVSLPGYRMGPYSPR